MCVCVWGGGVPVCFIHIFIRMLHHVVFWSLTIRSFKKLSHNSKVAFSLWVTLNIVLSTCISLVVVFLSDFRSMYIASHPLLIFLGLLVFFKKLICCNNCILRNLRLCVDRVSYCFSVMRFFSFLYLSFDFLFYKAYIFSFILKIYFIIYFCVFM